MIVGLLVIFGAYGLAVAMVHLLGFLSGSKRTRPVYYVLITRDNAMHIEWYLRSLLFFSALKGRTVKMIVLDEGSGDETTAIAERMAAARPGVIEMIRWKGVSQLDSTISRLENEQIVLVKLAGSDQLQKLPIFQH
jgi:hypothetical protein